MVTQPTLFDVLIEAGFEAPIARRAAEVIERDLAGVAQQPDMDRRFDRIEVRLDVMEGRFALIDGRFEQVEERLQAQDRLIEARFEAVDKEFQTVHQRIDDLKESMEREIRALHQRIDDLKENMDRRFNVLTWAIALISVLMIGGFGAIIALLIYILERLP